MADCNNKSRTTTCRISAVVVTINNEQLTINDYRLMMNKNKE
jgi:hypothetical protein